MQAPEHRGHAFGLCFRSARCLGEMTPAADWRWPEEEVDVEWLDAVDDGTSEVVEPFWLDGQGNFHLGVPGFAKFEIGAKHITVHPAPSADERSVRAFLFGSAIGALLQLRGLTVLHGSAVGMPDGGAAVFCGLSTAGKSTLAAAFAVRGYPALADDITAIRLDPDGQAWCLPGLARTKLWRDALQHLGFEHRVDDGTRVMPDVDKHSLSVVTGATQLPLRHIYELQVLDDGELALTQVRGLAKLNTLLAHVYRPQFLQAMGRQTDLLRTAAALLPRIQMHRITRPRAEQTLDEIVARLEAQWRA